MNFTLRTYIISCILLVVLTTKSQTHIILRNSGLQNGKPSVQIKWFSQNVVQEKPIYLFRKEATEKDWKLLHTEPFKVQNSISKADKAKDKELETFEEIVKARKQKPINGILMIALWVKAIESIPFADFVGIHHNDTTVQFGKTYQYCLRYTNNPYDPHIVIAQEVKASEQATLLEPVANFKVTVANKKEVGFLWKPENIRFWGVNIYRRRSDEASFKRITTEPLIINEYQSSDPKLKREYFVTDDSLKEGGLYFYKLLPVDFFGEEGVPTAEINVFIPDKSSPAPVVLSKDSAYKQTVWLRWTKSTAKDLKGYFVYRSKKSDADFQKLNTEPMVGNIWTYKDQPTESGDYYYFVSTVDTANNESPSNKVIANLDDVTPPLSPKGLVIKGDTGKVKLKWNVNTEKDLWGYYVYRGLSKQNQSAMVLITKRPFKGTFFIDSLNKVARNRFVYAVAAVDTNFNISALSDTLGAAMPDIVPPDKPYIKLVQLKDGNVEVEWLAGKEIDLVGFDLFLRAVPSLDGQFFSKRITADQRSTILKNPFQGAKTYKLYMTAIDKIGNVSEKSSEYLLYADDSKAKKQDLGKLKLLGSYKRKQKQVEFKWQHENAPKPPLESRGIILYEKTKEGEFKPLTKYVPEEKFRLIILEKGVHTFQIRKYFSDGLVLKSEELEIEIRD